MGRRTEGDENSGNLQEAHHKSSPRPYIVRIVLGNLLLEGGGNENVAVELQGVLGVAALAGGKEVRRGGV